MKIDPQCYYAKNIYQIDSSGHFFPCCFISADFYMDYSDYMTPEEYEMLDLSKHTFEEMIESGIYERWLTMMESENPLSACHRFCGKKESISWKEKEEDIVDDTTKSFDGYNTRTIIE